MLKMSQRIRSTLLILINAAHDGLRFLRQMACSHSAIAAENLFLRKQLAFYQEHKIRPRRLTNAAPFSLLLWSRLFDWQAAWTIVKPDTFLRWRREAYKRFWQWKSRAGRPRLPENIRLQRISGRDHGSLPNPVRVADHGDRQTPDSALQRYPTSDCGMDLTAVSRKRSQ